MYVDDDDDADDDADRGVIIHFPSEFGTSFARSERMLKTRLTMARPSAAHVIV